MIGLFFMGLGISLITRSYLGTSPISSVPYVLCLIFPITFGGFAFLLGLLFLVMEILILGKDFPKKQLLQLFVGVLLGVFIDVGMYLSAFVNPEFFAAKIVTLLLGCIVLALGVYLEISANSFLYPADAIVKVIAQKSGKKFGTTKILFDSTLCCVAGLISLSAFGTIKGLGEGTVISALLVGYIITGISTIFLQFSSGKELLHSDH
ncbi:YczE/YyaS/YitT family protein [Methanosphaerula subterraneus]|uniref:YczE/YyaS/YitT family protein n=1 Tax=Methanosphaerula subterraneus TaxID=3350244 RepID=UPI003F85C9BF